MDLTLPPTVQAAFDSFLRMANLDMLHPLDLERFDLVTILAHEAQADIEMNVLLQGRHLPSLDIRRLVTRYENGRDLLRVFDKHRH